MARRLVGFDNEAPVFSGLFLSLMVFRERLVRGWCGAHSMVPVPSERNQNSSRYLGTPWK